jgi:hypothetical protein
VVVAAACASVLLAQLAFARRAHRGKGSFWAAAVLGLAGVVASVSAVGTTAAFPFVELAVRRASGSGAGAPSRGASGEVAAKFANALFDSGNAGMLFWLLPLGLAGLVLRRPPPSAWWPLALLFALFSLTAASSLWLIPEFTLDDSTVHRALLVVEVPGAIWLGGELARHLAAARAS